MLLKITAFLTPQDGKMKALNVFWVLLAIAIFIRFPFFFRDYIDRDESTFILMGQSWVDGHLPYTQLWDLKPPITFLFFALIISVFGKSFLAIRLIGCFVVALTALYSYKISALIGSKKIAFWSAVGCVLLQSMFGSLQGVMSEHISIAFFMPALFIVLTQKKWLWLALAGVLMGLAFMTKLNFAYPILVVVLYLLFDAFKTNRREAILNTLALGLGLFLVIISTLLPYAIQGIPDIWWNSIFRASMAYADTSFKSLVKTAPLCVVFMVFLWWAWKRTYLEFRSLQERILLLAFLGILFSFIKAGKINGHYLIQLYPIYVIFIGIVLHKIVGLQKIKYKPLVLLLLLLLPVESYIEYFRIIKNKVDRGTYYNGEGIVVPQYLIEHKLDVENILFTEYHIGYWQLGLTPPTKAATHPSSICRDELFPYFDNPRKTSLDELRYILEDLRPQTIVIRKNRSIFDKKLMEENNYIHMYLSQNYDTIAIVDAALIFGRLERK
jgi:4-amino-4-deoxy-L-arabinose transferase-like glycosyltransferase